MQVRHLQSQDSPWLRHCSPCVVPDLNAAQLTIERQRQACDLMIPRMGAVLGPTSVLPTARGWGARPSTSSTCGQTPCPLILSMCTVSHVYRNASFANVPTINIGVWFHIILPSALPNDFDVNDTQIQQQVQVCTPNQAVPHHDG